MKPTPPPGQVPRPRARLRVVGQIALWVTLVPVVMLAALYVTLLAGPVPLPFLRDAVRDAVTAALPNSSSLELGAMALALERGSWPVLQFSPVILTDEKTGSKVAMDALEVGFSPVRAIVGQPGVTVTMVSPHVQIVQDLFGPRLTSFDIIEDPEGGRPTVRVLEGEDAFPSVAISSEGLDVQGVLPTAPQTKMRSDNDWLIYNLEAAQTSIADIVEQARLGRFSRLVIREGRLDMNDALYGLFRRFDQISIDIAPNSSGTSAAGNFEARFGTHVMHGILERSLEPDGTSRLKADVTNLDFAAFMPFIDDSSSVIALEGAGAVSMDLHYSAAGKLTQGTFRVDLTGTELRIEGDYFPIATSIIEVDWLPATGQFNMAESELAVGQSSGKMAGSFALGLDPLYGPTVAMSVTGSDVAIRPYDMEAPETAFTTMKFSGWSAPLYGATGIDQFTAEKPGARLATKGRTDMLRAGLGFNMTVVAEGISADDLKRLWPYFIARESRDWFVANIDQGTVQRSTMKYDFPVGALSGPGENKPLPPDSISIDMAATGVRVKLIEGLDPLEVEGETRLWMRDAKVTFAADGAHVPTSAGQIGFANAAMVMDSDKPGESIIEISGDVTGSIPAILALTKQQQPDALAQAQVPIDLEALAGNVALTLVSTIKLDTKGEMTDLDYAVNGTVTDFGSTAPIETHTIEGGQLSFVASQQSYRVAGQAKVDGLNADVIVEGATDAAPTILISATLDIDDLKSVGFDTSQFLSGKVKFVGKPMPDGNIQLAVDLADAALTIQDLGISKPVGVPGLLEAEVKQTGTLTELTRVNLSFGDVSLQGSLDYDLKAGLVSADFTNFAMQKGDSAQIAITPISGGYQLKLRGDQLDLKPTLQRFFGLGAGSTGGPQATVFTQTIVLDAKLNRALGFYRTTALNLDLKLTLKGSDVQKVSLQAQMGNGRAVSVTTNPGPQGKILSVAFNDLGSLLRMLNVYANLQGGEGSLVMSSVDSANYEIGELIMRNFAIVDEAKVAEIVQQQGQRVAAGKGDLAFDNSKVEFIRRKDRVEVTEGVLSGGDIGGTIRGFIYTDRREYDLTGTYVPLFGLNSVWQKLPIIGPILGGRDGEGLFGVTFAVKGPLDKPDFKINPLSALAPGLFRSLFEFRAKEKPRVE